MQKIEQKSDLSKLQTNIGYEFSNSQLLELALMHPSLKAKPKYTQSYERLEFLGDSLLNFIISEKLFTDFGNYSEGKLSKLRMALVCKETLYKVAKDIQLSEFLLLDIGEEMMGGRSNPKNLENAMEALIAAVYLDSKLDYGVSKITEIILKLWDKYLTQDISIETDPKTVLQEFTHKHFSTTPKYTLTESYGPAHDLNFKVILELKGQEPCEAIGKNKKSAEKAAALAMLKKLKLLPQ
ncbi:MAG: ribonuclease III [Rickettsiaceae bacterium]|nr:ribonuclease III [Rickettsiaceae bacterium]